jgi:hypothetical protein
LTENLSKPMSVCFFPDKSQLIVGTIDNNTWQFFNIRSGVKT